MSRHHILIVGGGFAGRYTAMQLEKALEEDPESA